MLPYGLVKIQAPINAEPSKARARQGARREIVNEAERAAAEACRCLGCLFDDSEAGLISHCATCDFFPCCCVCERSTCSPS